MRRPEVGKLRPAGRMRPAGQSHVHRQYIIGVYVKVFYRLA